MTSFNFPGRDTETLTGGVPFQMEHNTVLATDPASVFAWVTNFAGMPAWRPLIKGAELDTSQAEADGHTGSVVVIHNPPGPDSHETIKAWVQNQAIAYSATDEALYGMYTEHTSFMFFNPAANGTQTEFRWIVFGRPGRNFFMRWFGRWFFGWILRKSIRNLENKFGKVQ